MSFSSTGVKDITHIVRNYQLNSARGQVEQSLTQDQAPRVMAALLSDPKGRGIGGLTFKITETTPPSNKTETAVPAKDIPAYLNSKGLNAQQIAVALYALHLEIREKGTLSPGEDNMVATDLTTLYSMGSNKSISQALVNKYMEMEKAKSFERLFAKGGAQRPAQGLASPTPYGVPGNENAIDIAAVDPSSVEAAQGNKVHNPKALLNMVLGGSYLPRPDLDAAAKVLFT